MSLYRLSLFLVASSSITVAFSPTCPMRIRSPNNLPVVRTSTRICSSSSRLHVLLAPPLQESETEHSATDKPELQIVGVMEKAVDFLANKKKNSEETASEQDTILERMEQILFQMTLYRFALFLAMTAPLLVHTPIPAAAHVAATSHSSQVMLDHVEEVASKPDDKEKLEQVFDILVNKNRKGALQDMEENSDRLSLDISKTTYSSIMKSPPDAYIGFAEKGASNAHLPKRKILHQSILGGCYVGFGGLVSLLIAGNLGASLSANSPGVAKMILAALFPVNLLLIVATSGQLFTGNSATVTAARFEGFVSNKDLWTSFALSLMGNIIGCALFAKAAMIAQVMNPGAIDLVIKTAMGKCCAVGMGAIFVKAIMCNWMVSMAVYLATAANDLPGKVFGIYLPISTFVGIGLEHSVANFFILPLALMVGAPLSLNTVIFKNLIPVVIGNGVAGALVVAASYSYQYGRLGGLRRAIFQQKLANIKKELALKRAETERRLKLEAECLIVLERLRS